MILNEAIYTKIMEQVPQLIERGDILSDEKLAEYYQLFKQTFGPEKLMSMDGEILLSTMHDTRNRDSLVYWLEFKNDEQMPNRFGSIAGGSGLKFGIYRKGETGLWMTGSPAKQETLTVEAAIAIARRHRDQLIAGTKILEVFPLGASNEDYASLQLQMDDVAPEVSNSAWGHKYFSMLFPDKLEDYHNAYYQRFHLIKLLQLPYSMDGRYTVAGQYMAIAKELNLHINNLSRILNAIDGNPYRYWSVKANYSDTYGLNWKKWEEMRDQGYVGIGWTELGDLSELNYDQESRSKLKMLMQEKYKEPGGFAQEVFNFAKAINVNDIVLATEKNGKILGIGRIKGSYYFQNQADNPHRLPVEWLDIGPWTIPIDQIKNRVVREISSPENLIEVEKRILGLLPQLQKGSVGPGVTLSGTPARINEILERKRQVILYGPPGTGKTYWAYKAVLSIAALNTYKSEFSKLTDEQTKSITGDAQVPGLVRFCTFHPSYGYEDFIEGYRPYSENGVLGFRLRSGIFKQLCSDAKKQPDNRFYLIIDEINRGDIPRIFGELITILEKDKRGRTVFLPVSGESFSIPENVYLVGTMNTADRSIALLDTALRRRFGFIELMPDPKALGDTVVNGIPLSAWLEALNNRILQSVGRDARNLQIGHAYLLENGKSITDFMQFVRIFRDDIIPLLEEYCYEDYEVLEKVLGKGIVDREKQRIRHELFEDSRKDDLVQALLEPSPEITTSIAAIQHGQAEMASEEEDEQLNGTTSG